MDGRQQHLVEALRARELFGRAVLSRPQVRYFQCAPSPELCCGSILNDPQDTLTPVFAAEYSKVFNNSKFLALGDEDGYVTIINTATELPACTMDDDGASSRPSAQWEAHKNAIFDVAWTRDDTVMLTASGDQTISRFDTSVAELLGRFCGHSGSVKTVCAVSGSGGGDVFASGARDGALMVWDARVPAVAEINGDPHHRPVITINDAHAVEARKRSRRRTPNYGRNRPSVTSVLCLESEHALASGGVDGCVKLWDLRAGAAPSVVAVVPGTPGPRHLTLRHLADAPTPSLSQKQHGITCLALRPGGAQLLVSLTGGHQLLYDTKRPDAGPRAWYGGHTVSSFYVKAAFSPDGSHILSGSSDRCAYIWQVEGTDGSQPTVLKGHEGEVTAVAWCPTDFDQIATSGDDAVVKVWAVQRQQPPERLDQPASLLALGAVGSSGRSLQDVPAAALGSPRSPGITSPLLGAKWARSAGASAAMPMGSGGSRRSSPRFSRAVQQQEAVMGQSPSAGIQPTDENADGRQLQSARPQQQGQQQASIMPSSSRAPLTPAGPAAGHSPAVTVNPLRQLQFTGRSREAGAAYSTGPLTRRTRQQTMAAFLRSPEPQGPAPAAGCRPACPTDWCDDASAAAAAGSSQQQASAGKRDHTPAAMAGSGLPAKRLRISFERGHRTQQQEQQQVLAGQQQGEACTAGGTGTACRDAAVGATMDPSPLDGPLGAKLPAAAASQAADGNGLAGTPPALRSSAARAAQTRMATREEENKRRAGI